MNIYLSKTFTRLASREGLTNSRDNIEDDEMKALKRLTKYYLTLKPSEIKAALQCGELNEVNCNEKKN